MAIQTGDKLPAATFMRLGESGPEAVDGNDILNRGKVALFAVPGAYTPTCHKAHMPSFVASAEALREKGVERIVCVSVNDPFVMDAWGKDTGAEDAGIAVLADPDGAFTRAVGLEFDGSGAGLGVRSRRYSMLVENGVVKALNVEDSPGEATCSRGEALLDDL